MSFNKITIVGNLGRDPELKFTPQGNAVANFSVATTEKRKDKNGEMQNQTTWFRATLWGKTAENAAKYLSKGSQVYLEGRLRIEEWTDRDGNNRSTLEVSVSEMQFLSGGSNQSGGSDDRAQASDAPGEVTEPTAAPPDDDDIPF